MKKLIMASITAVVVIAVLAGTLIPILDDATENERTFTNEGYFKVADFGTTDAFTMTWDAADPETVTVNGTEVTLPVADATASFTILATDNWIMRSNGATTYLQFMDEVGPRISAEVGTSNTTMTVSLSGGSGTVTNGVTSANVTYTELYSIYTSGDYVMKNASESAYVLADSPLIGMGRSKVANNANIGISIRGDVEAVTVSEFTDDGVTISNVEINATEMTKYVDLYAFDSITMDATLSGTTTALTYNYIIVPAEVTADRAVQFTDGENAIFNAIPVMVIIALLLGVVALVLRSRMD